MLSNGGAGEDSWRAPWTARRSNQSILKEISPEYSLEGLMLKLKLRYFGHLMWRADSLKKTLMLGKTEGRRRGDRGWGGWMASLTQWTRVWANSGRQWSRGKPGMLQSMGITKYRTSLRDWTTTSYSLDSEVRASPGFLPGPQNPASFPGCILRHRWQASTSSPSNSLPVWTTPPRNPALGRESNRSTQSLYGASISKSPGSGRGFCWCTRVHVCTQSACMCAHTPGSV